MHLQQKAGDKQCDSWKSVGGSLGACYCTIHVVRCYRICVQRPRTQHNRRGCNSLVQGILANNRVGGCGRWVGVGTDRGSPISENKDRAYKTTGTWQPAVAVPRVVTRASRPLTALEIDSSAACGRIESSGPTHKNLVARPPLRQSG